MRSTILISVFLLAANAAHAAETQIPVSAGEHDGYSRIAFDNGGRSIVVEQRGRVIRLRNIDASANFDFRSINERRKAYRVLNAKLESSGNGKTIELILNCDCALRTTTLKSGKFVLDVLDPASAAAKPAADAEEQKIERAAERVGQTPSQQDIISIEHAHDQMIALLKQAAEEGLITIKKEPEATDAPEVLTEPAPSQPSVASAEPAPAKVAPVVQASHEPARKAACYPDKALFIDGAAFENDPLVEISNLQAQLADGTSEDVALVQNLVAGFLSIGFGEEALALLRDNRLQDAPLADVARIIAEQPLDKNGPLLAAQNCQGAHALWQAVAGDPADTLRLYKRSGHAIETLPSRLRVLIATRLAINFIAAENWDAAQELYQIASADAETAEPDLDYVRARLDQHQDNSDASRDTLLDIASGNSEVSGDALLALADTYAKHEAAPYDGFTEDIGALAKESGSSKAALAEAGAWAKLGNLDAAMFLLEDVAKKSASDFERARRSAQAILNPALTDADEQSRINALDAFLKHKDWFASDQRASDTRIVGARASEQLGLPNLAYSLLNGVRSKNDRALLKEKADAALAAGDPREALKVAAPYSGDPDFGKIVVNANLAAGQYDAALAATAALPEGDEKDNLAARAAWLARSWTSAADSFRALDPNLLDNNTALQFALAAYKAHDTALPAAVDAVLSQNNGDMLDGLRSFFAPPPQGSALERSRQDVEQANKEILMIQEILNNG